MAKNRLNNLIAFTLSEMMVVILIFSVISAAILPSVLGKKQTIQNYNDETPVTRWQGESATNGIYYQNGSTNTQIFMGLPLGTALPTDTPNPTLTIANSENSKDNPDKRSDIEFFDNGKNVGRLAVDVLYKNVLLGKNNSLSLNSDNPGYNILLGNTNKLSNSNRNVLIGNYIDISKSSDSNYNVIMGYGISNINAAIARSVNLGYYTGSNTAGVQSYNVNIGPYASYNIQQASSYNVNIGNAAGSSSNTNTKNTYNTNIGYYSGYVVNDSNTNTRTFTNGVNIGYYAGYMYNSQAAISNDVNIGTFSGTYSVNYASCIVESNVNIGYYAGYSGCSSNEMFHNVSIGANAGQYQSRYKNTYLGVNAGNNSSGWNNTFIGYSSGKSQNSRSNTFIGYNAGVSQSGYDNVFIGYNAGRYHKGSCNTFVGINAGQYNTSSTSTNSYDGNTIIRTYHSDSGNSLYSSDMTLISGYYAGTSNISTGWAPKTTSSKRQTLIVAPYDGTTKYPYSKSVITLYANKVYAFTSTITSYSDRRLKENIVPVEKSLDKIKKINVYEFSMKSDKNHEPRIGVIAQEIKDIIPQAVGIHPFTKYYYINSDWIMFNLINAIKELDKYVQDFQSDLKSYITQLFDIKNKLEILETKMENIAHSQSIMQVKLKEIDKRLDKVESK
ncbi:tail fiber domain-containing protein [bacterium]|nr:tail fiber domain-containing protein [bacterium]